MRGERRRREKTVEEDDVGGAGVVGSAGGGSLGEILPAKMEAAAANSCGCEKRRERWRDEERNRGERDIWVVVSCRRWGVLRGFERIGARR